MKLASVPDAVRQAEVGMNPDTDITNSVKTLFQFTVAPGSRTGQAQFPAPAVTGSLWVIAYTGDTATAKALSEQVAKISIT